MKNRVFKERLLFALGGITAAWRREASFRTQIVLAGGAVALLLVIRPSAVWCALVVLAASLVLAAELINSALETLIDHVHPATHGEIRIVKDMAAAAVLIASGGALIVGVLLIFGTLWHSAK